MKHSKRGFTLVELMVSVVVSGLLMLTIGVLAQMGDSSYKKLTNRIQIYNEVTNGFKLAKNRIRRASSCQIESATGNWPVGYLLIDNIHQLGIYQDPDGTTKELVYLENSMSSNDILISVKNTETLTLAISVDDKKIELILDVEKNNYPVNLKTVVMRRI